MNCIIVEDQPPAQRILRKYIEDIGTLNLLGVFSDAIQAMEFLKSHEVGLIFLDVHLPKLSGIEFLKILPDPPHVILTTAFSDYALESYDLNVVDYLLKPFSFQRFVQAVSKIPAPTTEANTPAPTATRRELFIKSGHDYIRLKTEELVYIHSDADYTELQTTDKKYLSSESLRDWLKRLDSHQFVRVHKSYIVNAARIEKVSGNQVYLEAEMVVPIGRAYKEDFIQKFVRKPTGTE
ncbi:LytTR family DNA-binding domain-containing protein [Pontibacter sp. G13]|uniref:LytR/AlgR family response regulator transcription factor n=1 Tax=Pontibacter sp. G13 TaxID=3074898 RepID=UPI00288977D0|nr:LytTR family DNA-binding domain-containing protein [Pontibacter sp. G13]WNJ20437.1 LytTR family DNA-binding domain-containing protein [Pontibacter sp. G13]